MLFDMEYSALFKLFEVLKNWSFINKPKGVFILLDFENIFKLIYESRKVYYTQEATEMPLS